MILEPVIRINGSYNEVAGFAMLCTVYANLRKTTINLLYEGKSVTVSVEEGYGQLFYRNIANDIPNNLKVDKLCG